MVYSQHLRTAGHDRALGQCFRMFSEQVPLIVDVKGESMALDKHTLPLCLKNYAYSRASSHNIGYMLYIVWPYCRYNKGLNNMYSVI